MYAVSNQGRASAAISDARLRGVGLLAALLGLTAMPYLIGGILGLPFGIIMTGVGVISLAGIVVNNAIVLVEYIEIQRERGMAKLESIVDAGRLRRHVCAQSQQTPGKLVDQLEGLQVKIMAGAGEQGIQILNKRRLDQLVAPAAVEIQQFTTQLFQLRGLFGQQVFNALR